MDLALERLGHSFVLANCWFCPCLWAEAGGGNTGRQGSSVINVIAATYPVLISAPLFWLWLSESMTVQKLAGFVLVLIGLILAVL
jgi:hypothetical protein